MKVLKTLASLALSLALVITAFAIVPPIDAKAAGSVAIGSVLIQGSDVVIATTGATGSDDGLFHLVASDVNESAPVGIDVAQAPAASGTTFSVPLNKGAAESVLFKKFTVCVMSGGALKPVSNSMFILNPEAAAQAVTQVPPVRAAA